MYLTVVPAKGRHGGAQANPARRWWPLKHWAPGDVVIIVLGSAACIALAIWLESFDVWWARALTAYLFAFVLCGGGLGAYVGWALDETDEPANERKIMLQVVALAVGCPMLFVLGKQALGTPFDLSPGEWPSGADLVARIALSLPFGFGVFALLAIAARRRTSGDANLPVVNSHEDHGFLQILFPVAHSRCFQP